MRDTIDEVTIVGGGDSGLLAGLCLQKLNPGLDISVVDDFERDVPQVGKSTYLRIYHILHDVLDVDEEQFVADVKPVWKASVYFRDWCGNRPFHYPFDGDRKFPSVGAPDAVERYYYYYDECYDSPDHRTRCEQMVDQRKSPYNFSPRTGELQKYTKFAYHLNTRRFNDFLRDLCRKRGIDLVDDEIVAVETTGDHVDRIRSESETYEADLYVDASGFNRVIKSELDAEFREFDLPLDSAFNARADYSLSDAVPATVIETGDNGWFWQIDTYDNRDLGYVFASEFVDDDAALAEFVEHCPDSVSEADVAKYEFTSGYHDRAWQGNCVTIGNAEGFVEPLQSTGLTANAQAAVRLSNLLSSHGRVDDEAIRDTYNAWVRQCWESIHDFISIHYRFADGDTEFWESVQSLEVSDRVEHLVSEFDRNGFDTNVHPTWNDPDVEDPIIFRPKGYYVMLRNMGVTSEFYEDNEFEVSDDVRAAVDDYYRTVEEEVAGHHTVEEYYRGVLDL